MQGTSDKQHWPTWAIIVLVLCILLSALAFLIGNCINKRAAPLRFGFRFRFSWRIKWKFYERPGKLRGRRKGGDACSAHKCLIK